MIALFPACKQERQTLTGNPNDGELTLPGGFEAIVVVDSIGPARHLAVRDNGDIYANLSGSAGKGEIVALRDTTSDGEADVIREFGAFPGDSHTGAEIYDGHLYIGTDLRIYRYRLPPGQLVPEGAPDTIVVDDHAHGSHAHIDKPISFSPTGGLFTSFGPPNNACQEPKRTPGVPGQDPCPVLDDHAGIWQFDAHEKKQTQEEGSRFATGIRNVLAIDWHPVDSTLYVVQHGRDSLHRLWPNRFTPWENAMLPAEELLRLTEGSNFGWPYCYYDQLQGKKVLAPEYGGDGERVGRCDQYKDPLIGFPGHFAPNDLLFYQGNQFPSHYRNGAFIAFHGSTIRDPYPQAGYFVGFVPYEKGKFGEWEVFANGFAGVDTIRSSSDAKHRPGGLAVGPDGSLYVTEDNEGKIWRILYTGKKEDFGEAQLSRMEKLKRTAPNISTPDKKADNLRRGEMLAGEKLYDTYCASCHQQDGGGAPPRYPPLAGTDWVTGDKRRLISVIVNGLEKPIEVNGRSYNNAMPQHSFLSDREVARIATYIRQNFGNNAGPVKTSEVEKIRKALNN